MKRFSLRLVKDSFWRCGNTDESWTSSERTESNLSQGSQKLGRRAGCLRSATVRGTVTPGLRSGFLQLQEFIFRSLTVVFRPALKSRVVPTLTKAVALRITVNLRPYPTRSYIHTGPLVIETATPTLWLIPPRD
jgi:hypothetical protein